MASIFDIEDVGGPRPSPVTPKATPVDTSGVQRLQTVSNVLGGVRSLAPGFRASRAASRKAQAEAATQTTVGSFLQQQLTVADAVEQGTITSQEGRSRLRANLSTALSNNPALTEDIRVAHSSIVTAAGGAKVVAEGTEEEKQFLKMSNEAREADWVANDASPEQVVEQTQDYFKFKRAKDDHSFKQQQLTFTKGRVDLTKSQLELETAVRVSEGQKALGALADTYSAKFSRDINTIRESWENGDIDSKQAVIDANNAYAVIQTTINSVGLGAGATYVNALVEPMTTEWNNFKELATGALDKTIYENQLANLKTRQQYNVLVSDSVILEANTLQSLLKNADLSSHAAVAPRVSERMRLATGGVETNPFSSDAEEKKAKNAHYDVLKQNMRGSVRGTLVNKEQTESELAKHIDNELKSVTAFGPTRSSAEDMTDTVGFIASPEFGRYTVSKGGVPSTSAPQARAIIQQQYEQVVLPLLVGEYDKAINTAGVRAQEVTADIIAPQFRGSGVTFVALDPSDQGAVVSAQRLNSSTSPILNQIIRMSSHLDGSMNYEKEYEKNYAPLFNVEEVDDNSASIVLPTPTPTPPVEGSDDETSIANGPSSSSSTSS